MADQDTRSRPSLQIVMTAGEISGDILGARLMRALKEEYTDYELCFSGVGGPLMAEEGLHSLFPMDELSVMGVSEVLPHLRNILKRISQAADYIVNKAPDILVTIDAPDFSFRVARKVQKRTSNVKMVHYVAPTVWAWRPKRARKVADLYDGVLCLFPMEPPYFEKEGAHAAFIGHPILENNLINDCWESKKNDSVNGNERPRNLGLLLGSRTGELKRIGPVLQESVMIWAKKYPDTNLIVPTLPHLEERVRGLLANVPCPAKIVTDKDLKYKSFQEMDMAMAVSGTVGLELAAAGIPHVIAYKFTALSAFIGRLLIKTPYAHLANILLGRMVVPEFIQQDCTPENIAGGLDRVLQDVQQTQRKEFETVRRLLRGTQKSRSSSAQAASFIREVIASR